MNSDNEIEIAFSNLNNNIPKIELEYLEVYALEKDLVNKSNISTEEFKALISGLNYLNSMRTVYLESRNASKFLR